jgi:exo-beta-1,3-glucanase (GH17 family)
VPPTFVGSGGVTKVVVCNEPDNSKPPVDALCEAIQNWRTATAGSGIQLGLTFTQGLANPDHFGYWLNGGFKCGDIKLSDLIDFFGLDPYPAFDGYPGSINQLTADINVVAALVDNTGLGKLSKFIITETGQPAAGSGGQAALQCQYTRDIIAAYVSSPVPAPYSNHELYLFEVRPCKVGGKKPDASVQAAGCWTFAGFQPAVQGRS